MTDNNDALDLFEMFSTNRESEEDGVWIELSPKTSFKIRAFSAKIVGDTREKLMKPFTTLLRAGGKIPDEKNDEIGLKVVAGAILADWKGVVIDGETVKYSADAAFELLKKLPKLANFIASTAMETAHYREEVREENAKNS